MKKKVLFLLNFLTIICAALFLLWVTNNINNEKQLNEDLSVRFDETMTQTFPLLEKVARAYYYNVNKLEQNATHAHDYYTSNYAEAFRQLNIQYSNTEQGAFSDYWLREYRMFSRSAAYSHLEHGGKLRNRECQAFLKLICAYDRTNGALDMDYDSLLYECQVAKLIILESINDLKKYHSVGTDVNSWRNISYEKYQNIFDRYYKNKNWPFNFHNK